MYYTPQCQLLFIMLQFTELIQEQNKFNRAVSILMAFSNHIKDSTHLIGSCDYHMALCTLCTLLAPMAPHVASEMWAELKEAAKHIQITSPKVCKINYTAVYQSTVVRYIKDVTKNGCLYKHGKPIRTHCTTPVNNF